MEQHSGGSPSQYDEQQRRQTRSTPRPSRLPVLRKTSATISSVDKTPSSPRQHVREHPIPVPRGNPTIAKRTSGSRLHQSKAAAVQGDRNFTDNTVSSIAKVTPRKTASYGSLNGLTASMPALRARASQSALPPATPQPQLARKPSAPVLESPMQSPKATPRGRRISDINGAKAPPLNRRASNTQLKQPQSLRKQSLGPLAHRPSLTQLTVPADASPTPHRRPVVGSGLPSPQKPQNPVKRAPLTPKLAARAQSSQRTPPAQAEDSASPKKSDHKKASQALRDTIRQARAAKMKATAKPQGDSTPHGGAAVGVGNGLDSFNFGTDDPFNQAISEGGSKKVLRQRIKSARTEGRLNISNLQLKEIPVEVYKMYETTEDDLAAQSNDDGPKWYESVDLARMIAADNEIEVIGEEMAEQFGGLTMIDIHNNAVTSLPPNFTILTELTVLNLSNNKLDNSTLDIIFKITSLKDLKLAKNGLEGELSSSVSNLTSLETLELQENKLTTLPSSLGGCGGLRVINVSHNSLEVSPVKEISRCALRELDVSENKLSGALFPECIEQWDSLQFLNAKGNRLTSFAEGSSVALPALHSLIVSNNQLASFPHVAGWNELLVLLVDENRIERLPEELFTLVRLRNLDFSRNHVKIIDPRLGRVESLEVISSNGNPLLDRKLAGMSTADLKRTLQGRLAPPEIVIAEAEDDDGEPALFPGMEPEEEEAKPKGLEVGRAGLLDLSRKGYEQLPSELMDSIIGSPVTMILSHNSLSAIPPALDRFASLCTVDLSFNKLSGEYLPGKLQLRSLQTLNLHNASLTSLDVLFKNLDASKLQTLDISANRIASIAGLRETFPGLLNLHAADNQISEVPVPSVDGIRVLDLSGNAIASLPPKLALCSNLRELRVQGNLFRVPRWQVLEKGAEAVLQWLRERLPPEETGEEEEEGAEEEEVH